MCVCVCVLLTFKDARARVCVLLTFNRLILFQRYDRTDHYCVSVLHMFFRPLRADMASELDQAWNFITNFLFSDQVND